MTIARETLDARAVETLRREIPEDLEWLPWGKLPVMRWDDGTPVDERTPRGWLVMAAERGNPEPDGELRQQAGLFDRGDAAALGLWLLEAWIDHDTAIFDLTPAREKELRVTAERAAEMARRFGRGGTDPEERFQQLVRQEGNRAVPSALPYKGLLAVVAACGDATVAPVVERYRERWKSERPEQCRLLSTVTSAIERRGG